MTQPPILSDRLAVLSGALPALDGMEDHLHQAAGGDLAGIISLCDSVAADAARMRTAAIAEAFRRGEFTCTMTGFVRENAPSLKQGGAQQVAKLAGDATKSGSLTDGGSTGPDPESPLGIVWDAVTKPAEASADADPDAQADTVTAQDATTQDATAQDAAADGVSANSEPPAPPLSPANALAVLSEMRILEPRLRPEAVPTVTRVLVELAREWGPAQMRRLRPRLLAEYGADGELDDLQDKLARSAFLSKPEVESCGLTEYRMAVTPAQAAALEAAIGPLSAPRPNPDTGERDLRPAGQRRIEALIEIVQKVLSSQLEDGGDGPTGAYAGIHVNLNLDDLRRWTGTVDVNTTFGDDVFAAQSSPWSVWPDGTTTRGGGDQRCRPDRAAGNQAGDQPGNRSGHQSGNQPGYRSGHQPGNQSGHKPGNQPGDQNADRFRDLFSGDVLGSTAGETLLSPAMLRQLACGAHLIPHVLGSQGEHLDQGAEIRLFNKAQRRKLLRRDKHCTYPGCDRPASWTRAHHVLHWFDDGWSDIDNAALLCELHHTAVHQHRLWADVRATPDEHGRYVVWDLIDGSYDRELERRRAERAANDPPRLTPALWEQLVKASSSSDPGDQAWAAYMAALYDDPTAGSEPDDAPCPPLHDPRIWDDKAQAFVDPVPAA